jgi:hypothetical protein
MLLRTCCALALVAGSLVGCLDRSASSDPDVSTSTAPLVGVDGSQDQADRACNIILRQMVRDIDVNGNPIVIAGKWTYVASIEVSTAAASEGLAPSLLYSTDATDSSPTWLAATGSAATRGATPGYALYTVTIETAIDAPLAVIPFITLTGGGRLFDHNRNVADLDSYALVSPDFAVWGAPAVCAAPADSRSATITFASNFTQTVTGVIVPGGSISIAYDSARTPTCRYFEGGAVLWDVTAHVRFDPDEEEVDVSVRDAAATVTVPTDGATSVSIWFENTSAYGCDTFDSNYGNNYVFAVQTPPKWLGLPTNLLVRDADDKCAGGADAATGFSFDTWARVEAYVTNLCFQVYQPGETDVVDPNLWQQLDVSIGWRLIGAANAASAWTTTAVPFEATVGNNAEYAQSWRTIDPFRDYHCPEVASSPTSDGMYQQISIEYVINVNGSELRPQGGDSTYGGTFIDYPTNPWRTANCP